MRIRTWTGLALAATILLAAYIWLVGVTVIHFHRSDIAAGYSTVCMQKSTVVPDEDDSRYSCPTTSGLHVWAGQDVYIFLHTGAPGDFTLICTDGDRRSVQHFSYYYGGQPSEVWKLDSACDGAKVP